MRRTLGYITKKQRGFASLPFFDHLRDRSLSPEQRFRFTPAIAPFVMAFADLNRFSLRVPRPTTELEQLINLHSEEDAEHFAFYLEDLHTLGFAESPCTLHDALQFLWADDHKCARQTCYALAAMLSSAPLMLRLVIVEAIEATGATAFDAFSELADEYRLETGKELRYFGRHHKKLETGHTMGTDDIEQKLLAMVLSDEDAMRAEQLVDRVFELFEAMMQELHTYGVANRQAAE